MNLGVSKTQGGQYRRQTKRALVTRIATKRIPIYGNSSWDLTEQVSNCSKQLRGIYLGLKGLLYMTLGSMYGLYYKKLDFTKQVCSMSTQLHGK